MAPDLTPERGNGVKLNIQSVILLIQLGAVIWGAATIVTKISSLTDVTKDLQVSLNDLKKDVSAMSNSIAVNTEHNSRQDEEIKTLQDRRKNP